MGLGQWGKKNKNRCMMFILAANQSCGFPEQPKIVSKSWVSYKMVLFTKQVYYRVRKVKWVMKNTC